MRRVLVLMVTLGILVGAAYAHNGMHHIMGTVISITDANIMVKGTDGSTQTVLLTGDTKYFAGAEAITAKAIKVGDHVVIHATKTGDHFTAAEVKIGAMRMKGTADE
jgi:hypothetical protein